MIYFNKIACSNFLFSCALNSIDFWRKMNMRHYTVWWEVTVVHFLNVFLPIYDISFASGIMQLQFLVTQTEVKH